MRYAFGFLLAVLFLVGLYLNAALSAPTPWSAPNDTFTRSDERLLEAQLPGGRYLSKSIYQRCERDGRLIHYLADGRTVDVRVSCWDYRRWIGREVSP